MARICAISGSESSSAAGLGLVLDVDAEGAAVVPFVVVELRGSTSILSTTGRDLLDLAAVAAGASARGFRSGERVRTGGLGGSRAGDRERVRCLVALDGGGLSSVGC